MSDLPSGTVTFLFTDIEGSTRLLQQLGDGYASVLAQHRRLLREAFGRHDGVEVDTQGDSFFFAFADPHRALAAAILRAAGSLRGRRQNAREPTPGLEPVRTTPPVSGTRKAGRSVRRPQRLPPPARSRRSPPAPAAALRAPRQARGG